MLRGFGEDDDLDRFQGGLDTTFISAARSAKTVDEIKKAIGANLSVDDIIKSLPSALTILTLEGEPEEKIKNLFDAFLELYETKLTKPDGTKVIPIHVISLSAISLILILDKTPEEIKKLTGVIFNSQIEKMGVEVAKGSFAQALIDLVDDENIKSKQLKNFISAVSGILAEDDVRIILSTLLNSKTIGKKRAQKLIESIPEDVIYKISTNFQDLKDLISSDGKYQEQFRSAIIRVFQNLEQKTINPVNCTHLIYGLRFIVGGVHSDDDINNSSDSKFLTELTLALADPSKSKSKSAKENFGVVIDVLVSESSNIAGVISNSLAMITKQASDDSASKLLIEKIPQQVDKTRIFAGSLKQLIESDDVAKEKIWSLIKLILKDPKSEQPRIFANALMQLIVSKKDVSSSRIIEALISQIPEDLKSEVFAKTLAFSVKREATPEKLEKLYKIIEGSGIPLKSLEDKYDQEVGVIKSKEVDEKKFSEAAQKVKEYISKSPSETTSRREEEPVKAQAHGSSRG